MLSEALAAALVGIAVLWVVLQPMLRRERIPPPAAEPMDPEETPKGIALSALKEIDFDRETGKLSDADYEFLKAKYTAAALEALRAEPAELTSDSIEAMIAAKVRRIRAPEIAEQLRCRTCGPRPEPDAVFCSTCGLRLAPPAASDPNQPGLPNLRAIQRPA
jgi:hypothetical protein